MTNSTLTVQERWENAIAEAEANGVVITEKLVPARKFDNESGVTLGELSVASWDSPHAFTLGACDGVESGYEWSEDGSIAFYRDRLVRIPVYETRFDGRKELYGYEEEIQRTYDGFFFQFVNFYCGGEGTTSIIMDAFMKQGFEVELGGNRNEWVRVNV